MKGRKWVLIALAATVVAGCAIWLLHSERREAPKYALPSDASPLFRAFYRHFMDDSGGVYTNLRNDMPKVAGTAAGHQMLAESTGLLMHYAIHRHDRKLFEQQKAFLDRHLLAGNGLVRWMVDPDDPRNDARSNASVDDLRIVSALLEAEREWPDGAAYGREADRIASSLLRNNVKDGLPADYYDWQAGKLSDTVTISYLDLQTLRQLAAADERWQSVADAAGRLVKEGALPNGLFRKTYDLKRGSWVEPEEIHLVDTLYCAYHLAETGAFVQETVDFIEAQIRSSGRLNGRYLPGGQASGDIESPAVYALAIRLLERADGDKQTVAALRQRLSAMAVSDPGSPYYGAFVQLPSLEGYSFDHLEALLTE